MSDDEYNRVPPKATYTGVLMMGSSTLPTPKTPKDLASILAPHAREYLHRVTPTLKQDLGMIERWGVNHFLPVVEKDMEVFIEEAIKLAMERVGPFTVLQILEMVAGVVL